MFRWHARAAHRIAAVGLYLAADSIRRADRCGHGAGAACTAGGTRHVAAAGAGCDLDRQDGRLLWFGPTDRARAAGTMYLCRAGS